MHKKLAKGIEEYPLKTVIVNNLGMLFWIFAGAFGVWLSFPPLFIPYLLFSLIFVYIVLRKLVCTNCYYYNKQCALGWGKLSAFFFKKGKIEDFNKGARFAPFVYAVVAGLPILLLLLNPFSLERALVLVFLILFSAFTLRNRKNTCSNCKMRNICIGAAK